MFPDEMVLDDGHQLCISIPVCYFLQVKIRLVPGYGMIGMIGTPKEYGRYMYQYMYSMHIC